MSINPQLHESWKAVLADEFAKPYFFAIREWLVAKKAKWETIYPPWGKIFNAFDLTPFDNIKVVILGQDPYHGPGQAMGLSFSVPDGVKLPPSLKNIYKEIQDDLWGEIPESGNLEHRADQGVFLLNAILTVTAKQPASHQDLGWQQFTDAVIRKISDQREGVIFLLRWNFARNKAILIDTSKHIILEAPHPSPFSVHKGFFGCKHFSTVNQLLMMQGKSKIEWFA